MSSHLRELIETVSSNEIYSSHEMDTVHAVEIKKSFLELSAEAVCFDMGNIEDGDWPAANLIPVLCRLPYPVCWFELTLRTWNMGILIWDVNDGERSQCGMLFSRVNHRWCFESFFRDCVLDCEDHSKTMLISCGGDKMVGRQTEYSILALRAFLTALNCNKGTQKIEHKPSEKLQKARKARGRLPLFSYWTLHLGLGESVTSSGVLGGTHASPRLHLRRGHARQYAPGKYCWVTACVVGSPHGFIDKDYAA